MTLIYLLVGIMLLLVLLIKGSMIYSFLLFGIIFLLVFIEYRREKHNFLLAAKILNTKTPYSYFFYRIKGDYKERKIVIEIVPFAGSYIYTPRIYSPGNKPKFFSLSSFKYPILRPTPHTSYYGGKIYYWFGPFRTNARWANEELTEAELIDAFDELVYAVENVEKGNLKY
jgi:hypothetical protein